MIKLWRYTVALTAIKTIPRGRENSAMAEIVPCATNPWKPQMWFQPGFSPVRIKCTSMSWDVPSVENLPLNNHGQGGCLGDKKIVGLFQNIPGPRMGGQKQGIFQLQPDSVAKLFFLNLKFFLIRRR